MFLNWYRSWRLAGWGIVLIALSFNCSMRDFNDWTRDISKKGDLSPFSFSWVELKMWWCSHSPAHTSEFICGSPSPSSSSRGSNRGQTISSFKLSDVSMLIFTAILFGLTNWTIHNRKLDNRRSLKENHVCQPQFCQQRIPALFGFVDRQNFARAKYFAHALHHAFRHIQEKKRDRLVYISLPYMACQSAVWVDARVSFFLHFFSLALLSIPRCPLAVWSIVQSDLWSFQRFLLRPKARSRCRSMSPGLAIVSRPAWWDRMWTIKSLWSANSTVWL